MDERVFFQMLHIWVPSNNRTLGNVSVHIIIITDTNKPKDSKKSKNPNTKTCKMTTLQLFKLINKQN